MTRAALARRPRSQDFNNTPLHYACRYCQLSICKMLRRAGAEVNQINELGITPLGFAAMFNQPEPRQGAYIKMIKWLIREGAKVNVVDKGGHTPLEIAASWGNMKLVSFLLQKDGRVRREVEYLSIKAPSPVDVAATDEVKHLLKTKLKKELADFAALKLARQEAELRRLEALEIEKENEKKRLKSEARKAARMEQRALKRYGADTAGRAMESAIEAALQREQLEQAKADAMEALKDTSGIWKKESRNKWVFERGVSKTQAQMASVTEEAQTLIDDMQGAEQRQMLQRRWKAMTGLEITEDHVVMGGNAGKKKQVIR